MLSDEEKKAIEWLKKADWFSARLYVPTILNLIEKQSKEIEELNIKILSNAGIYQLGFNDGEKKVKDKIKAKIQECREILYSFEKELELKANKEKYINKESMNCLLGQISILQSLLEKE